jgi:hypothetical protein
MSTILFLLTFEPLPLDSNPLLLLQSCLLQKLRLFTTIGLFAIPALLLLGNLTIPCLPLSSPSIQLSLLFSFSPLSSSLSLELRLRSTTILILARMTDFFLPGLPCRTLGFFLQSSCTISPSSIFVSLLSFSFSLTVLFTLLLLGQAEANVGGLSARLFACGGGSCRNDSGCS